MGENGICMPKTKTLKGLLQRFTPDPGLDNSFRFVVKSSVIVLQVSESEDSSGAQSCYEMFQDRFYLRKMM
jgi:hypothetical protein